MRSQNFKIDSKLMETKLLGNGTLNVFSLGIYTSSAEDEMINFFMDSCKTSLLCHMYLLINVKITTWNIDYTTT